MKIPRQQLVVCPRIQGDLIARMALVAVFSLTVCGILYAARNAFFPDGQGWGYALAPLVTAFVVTIPLVVFYAVVVTNKIVAPVIRLWHLTRLMSEDVSQVNPIEFREGDPWNELAHDFNTMLATIREELERDGASDEAETNILESDAGPTDEPEAVKEPAECSR